MEDEAGGSRTSRTAFKALRAVGPVSHCSPKDDPSHSLGPAIFGRVRTGQKEFIEYNAAVLFGATNGSPHTTLRLRTEDEF